MRIKIDLRAIFGYFVGPAAALALIFFGNLQPGNPAVTNTMAVAILMAVWWITELVPLAVTSLLPVVLFPILGIMDGREASSAYFNDVIFLFVGGFIVAIAMQRWNLHRRIALRILRITGVSPGRILLGFILATSFLSMWISNTATAMMMMPILVSIIRQMEDIAGKENVKKYAIGLLLAVAYSASIGGIATLVGTPPNQAFASIFKIMFPEAPEISFAKWFFFAMPFSVTFLVILWFYLFHFYRMKETSVLKVRSGMLTEQYKMLGPINFEEKAVLWIFVLLALLWLFRADLTFGSFIIPGWQRIFNYPEYLNDGTVAITMGITLFLIPSRTRKGERLMNWEAARDIPWDIVLLFGGGFALAAGFKESGLSTYIGNQLEWVSRLQPILIVFCIALLMTFLTELTSNTATTQMVLPVLAGLSVSTGIHPLLLMLPATISASCAFMLPVATPPNAIVFGASRLKVTDMARTGFLLNLIGSLLVTLFTYFLASHIFGFEHFNLPDWVHSIKP